MKLHGIVYIIAGAILVGFSYYTTAVNEKLELQKFTLFVWVGFAFIGVGLFKLILNSLSKPKKPKLAKENFQHNKPTQQQTNVGQGQMHHAQPNQLIKFCSGCGSAVRHFDNFCYKCGGRMFHKK